MVNRSLVQSFLLFDNPVCIACSFHMNAFVFTIPIHSADDMAADAHATMPYIGDSSAVPMPADMPIIPDPTISDDAAMPYSLLEHDHCAANISIIVGTDSLDTAPSDHDEGPGEVSRRVIIVI